MRRMEIFNDILCVTVAELTADDGGMQVMSYKNYNQLVYRHRINVVRPGKGLGGYALIEWSSIPARFKERFMEKYGDPEKMLKKDEGMLEYDIKAKEFFAEYILPDGKGIKSGKQSEYVVNASVLNLLLRRADEQRAARHRCGNSTPVNWKGIHAECESLRDTYGHTLPRNAARLREKMRQYRREGYTCLVSGRLLNTNARKITPEAGEYIIALKRSMVPVYTNSQILAAYNAKCAETGWKPLKSLTMLTQFLNRPDVKGRWYAAAHGELEAKRLYNWQHVTVLPETRDALWYMDGTKLNLYFKKYTQKGYVLSSVQVVEVVDAYSECFIGYHVSETECFESMYEAVRMAITNNRHLPVELVYDNQGGTKRADAKEWLAKVSVRCSRPTAPYNAASKTIESIFNRFQSGVMHGHFAFTGMNVTTKSASSRPNMEFVMANIENLPTYEEALALYAGMRDEWNSMPHPKYGRPRIELYESSANPESPEVGEAAFRELFWITSPKECRFTARGLQITVKGKEYTYDVYGRDGLPDMAFRRDHTGEKFHVQYDPHDMSKVRLCTKDGYGYRLVAEAATYVVVHRALQDQMEGERAFMRRMEDANKKERVRRHLEGMRLDMKYGTAPEQHGLVTPRPQGITDKEYVHYADIIMAEEAANGTPAAETAPETIGQFDKAQSNATFDQIAAYDKL